MKRQILILVASVMSFASVAQTTTNVNPPVVLGTNSTSSLGLIGNGLLGLGKTIINATPTNIVIAPYGTYVVQPKKFGYGLGVAYNLSLGPVSGGPIVLVDHVDQFLAFSGGLTLQSDLHPLSWFGMTSSFVLTPIGIAAVGTPLAGGGGSNGGIQTLTSVGADFKFGHLWGGQFLIGGAYGTRTGAGTYGGAYVNVFAGWKKGGIKIGLTLN